jgi:hypothetical protein
VKTLFQHLGQSTMKIEVSVLNVIVTDTCIIEKYFSQEFSQQGFVIPVRFSGKLFTQEVWDHYK